MLELRVKADTFLRPLLLPTTGYGDLDLAITDSFTIMPQTRRETCDFEAISSFLQPENQSGIRKL